MRFEIKTVWPTFFNISMYLYIIKPYGFQFEIQLSIPKQNAGSGGYGYSNNTLQPSHVRISLISAIEDRFRTLVSDKLGFSH